MTFLLKGEPVNVGLAFANTGPGSLPENALNLAREAEQLGMDSLWAIEHVVVPEGYKTEYGSSSDGRLPGGPSAPIPDPLQWLAFAGAHTHTIRLGTGVLILPQRNPVVLAKETATLDLFSSGRLDLGIGVGWLREEYEALGASFHERGRRADEYVQVLRALWSNEESFSGEYFEFSEARCYPKPSQSRVPIHVGGNSEAAARRAAHLGDGFFLLHAKNAEQLIASMSRHCSDIGRDAGELDLTVGATSDAARMEELVQAGIRRFTISPPWSRGTDIATGLADKLAALFD